MLPTCVATGLNSTFKARPKQGEVINTWPISDRHAVLKARVRFLLQLPTCFVEYRDLLSYI